MESKETPFSNAKYIYSVDVMYSEDYFENKETPLVHTYEVASSSARNLDDIQKLYTKCKVLSIEKIK